MADKDQNDAANLAKAGQGSQQANQQPGADPAPTVDASKPAVTKDVNINDADQAKLNALRQSPPAERREATRRTAEQAEEDRKATEARDANRGEATTEAKEIDKKAAETVKNELERRNNQNEEGVAKLVEEDEKRFEKVADAEPKPYVEDNRNTPIVDKHGNKRWT